MEIKSIFKSKTIWVGLAQIVFGAVGYFTGWLDSGTSSTLVITGATAIGLRFKTSQPIV